MLQMHYQYEDDEEEGPNDENTTPLPPKRPHDRRSSVGDGPQAKVSKKGVRDPALRLRDDYAAASRDTGAEANPQEEAARIARIGNRGTPLGKEINPNRKVMSDFKGSTRCKREDCTVMFPPEKVFRPHGSGWKTDCYCKTTSYRGVKDLLVVPLTPDTPTDL